MSSSVISSVDKAPLSLFTDALDKTIIDHHIFKDKELFWCLFCKAFVTANINNPDRQQNFWIAEEETQFKVYSCEDSLLQARETIEKIRNILLSNLKLNVRTKFVAVKHHNMYFVAPSMGKNMLIYRETGECSEKLFEEYIEGTLPVLGGFFGIEFGYSTRNRDIRIGIENNFDYSGRKKCLQLALPKAVKTYKIYWNYLKVQKSLDKAFPSKTTSSISLTQTSSSQRASSQIHHSSQIIPATSEKVTKTIVASTEDVGEYFTQQNVFAVSDRVKVNSFVEKFALFATTIKTFFSMKKYLQARENLHEVKGQIDDFKAALAKTDFHHPLFKIFLAKIDCLKATEDQCNIILKMRVIGVFEKLIFSFLTLTKTLITFEVSIGTAFSLVYPKAALIGFFAASALFVYKMLLEIYINRHNIPLHLRKIAMKVAHQRNRLFVEWHRMNFVKAENNETKYSRNIDLKRKMIELEGVSHEKKARLGNSIEKLGQALTSSVSLKGYYNERLKFYAIIESDFQSRCNEIDLMIKFNSLRGKFRTYDIQEMQALDSHLTSIVEDPAKKQEVRLYLKSLGVNLPDNYTKENLLEFIIDKTQYRPESTPIENNSHNYSLIQLKTPDNSVASVV